jgi:hypothetical protein
MIKIILFLFLLIPSLSHAYECNRELDNLSYNYGIKILCNMSSVSFPRRTSGNVASEFLLKEAEPAVYSFLKAYNKEFLRDNISSINIVTDLRLYNVEVGGISNGRDIYLNLLNYNSYNYKINLYKETLHHEFSSNIFKNSSFFARKRWKYISNAYDYSVEFMLKCLQDPKFASASSVSILILGYLNNYSITGEENDFNSYAEKLFMNNFEIFNKADKYENVRKKLNLLKIMYIERGFQGKFPGSP